MSTYTAIHDKADIQTVTVAFENFLTNPLAAQGQLTTESKTAFVSALVTDLGDTSLQAKWNDSVRLLAIQTLKTLGREVSGSDRLFSKEGIRVLMKHAGMIPAPSSVKDDSVSQEALKCLSNCLLLLSSTKAMFYENDGVKSSVFYMKWPKLSGDSRFLLSRVLFLMTVDCLDVVRLLIDDLNVADSIALILSENVQSLLDNPAQREGPISREMVISEVLKLLFNLLMHDSRSCRSDDKGKGAPDPRPILGIKTWTEQEEVLIQPAAKFESCLSPMLLLLTHYPYPSPLPLNPPHSHAIHALLYYPVSPYLVMWLPTGVEPDEYPLVRGMVDALDTTLRLSFTDDTDDIDAQPDSSAQRSVEDMVPSLAIVLGRVARADERVRRWMRGRMLPDDVDRAKALNRGTSFSARMIRTMTSTLLPNTRESISELLYMICNEDANLLIHHTGYGNAAGFLMNHGIAVNPSEVGAEADATTGRHLDPITGRYADAADEGPALADMTDEEKEREAERLFVLFERLKKTGVMDVENPIAKAMREGKGRVEEVEED